MKVSLNWLTDYVDIPVSAQELAGILGNIGFNCEEIVETPTDIVLDLEITSNRPDMLGHIGVAREIAAAASFAFHPPQIPKLPTSGRAGDLTAVEVLDPDLCPRYTARVIRGVKVGKSPDWMIERLAAAGQRAVNNIVDVTNYVLLEYSQPLHSFDYDKLAEHRIVVRRARPGEHLVSIDGTKCALSEKMLVIADARRPVAVAGIMGGLDSEVGQATTHVLIEAAQFDPLSIRMTSRTLALMSESNYRFERGVDPVAVEEASLRACQLILQLAGGQLAEGVVDAWAQPFRSPAVAMRPRRCQALLGLDVPPSRQAEILERIGLAPRMEGERIVCTIPPHRGDLRREADLIEEVARLAGYDKIPVAEQVTHAVVGESLPQRTRKQVAAALQSAGFDETITFSFIDPQEAELFGCPRPVHVDPVVRKTNNVLRMTLAPSLLRACKTNQDVGVTAVDFFELSAVFPPGPSQDGLPAEFVELGMATTRELRDLRGALEAAVQAIAPQAVLEVRDASQPGYADGAAAEVLLDGRHFGVMGQVDARVRDYYGLTHPVAAAAVNFDLLMGCAGATRKYQPVPKFPAVQRDLSLIVDEAVTWQQLNEILQSVAQPLRVAGDYVTTYRGKPIAQGRKSVTITLTYRCGDRTLRSEEVDEMVAQVVSAMKDKLSAELRA